MSKYDSEYWTNADNGEIVETLCEMADQVNGRIGWLEEENKKLRSDTMVNDYANVMEEVAYLKQENKKLRDKLEDFGSIRRVNDAAYEQLLKERDAWKELCGRWVGCALCIRDILKAKGYDITFNMPPEKPEGV